MTLMEFIGRYLSDENLREEIFTDERKLKNYIDPAQAQILPRLIDQEIFDEIQADAQLTDPQVVALRAFLKSMKFDAEQARRLIWGSEAACQRGDAVEASSDVSSKGVGGGGYGSGEVHLRSVEPRNAVHNVPTTIELAGQGFNRAIQVKFVLVGGNSSDEELGTIVAWRADADVHQYREVEVTFPKAGLWEIQIYDSNAKQFRPFTCGITVT